MNRVPYEKSIGWLLLLSVGVMLGGCTSSFRLPWEEDMLDASRVATVEPLEMPPDMEELPEPTKRIKEAEQEIGGESAAHILFGGTPDAGSEPVKPLGRHETARVPAWMKGDQETAPRHLEEDLEVQPRAPESFKDVLVSQKTAILEMVEAWAGAWKNKDIETYLGFYSSEFRTPRHKDRAAWERERRRRIGEAGDIELGISNLKVVFQDDGRAQAIFVQHYRSGNYTDKIRKLLFLRPEEGGWKILTELSEKL